MAQRSAGSGRWIWGAIGAVLVAFLVVIHLFWRESTQVLDAQLKQKLTRAQAQLMLGTVVPSPETYAFLHRRLRQLGEQYERLLAALEPPEPDAIAGPQDPGLYFREQLHTLQKRLERQAASRGISVTSTFGFSEDLPPADRVPLLLRQLALVETAASTLIAEGAQTIDLLRAIEPKPVEDPQTREPFLWELPLVVRARCATPTLVKFLYHMQEASPLVTIPEISLKEAQPAGAGMNVELLLVAYTAVQPSAKGAAAP